MSALTPTDRAEAAVCAEVLATGPYWWAVGLVFATLTVATWLLSRPHAPMLWPVFTTMLSVVSAVAVSRVVIDVGLFRALARETGPFGDLKALDVALVGLTAVHQPLPAGARTVVDRARGALRWWRGVVLVTVCQSCGWLVVCWQAGRVS